MTEIVNYSRPLKRMLELFDRKCVSYYQLDASLQVQDNEKNVFMHFYKSPLKINVKNGKVCSIVLGLNTLVRQDPSGHWLPRGMIFS